MSEGAWAVFQCPHCGYVKCYHAPPAGPTSPACTYGHQPIVMQPVEIYRAAVREDRNAS